MKYLFIFVILMSITRLSHAQDRIPLHYYATDIVYDAESIPNIGYEHFFISNKRLKSWRVNIGYQVHYNDSFGVATSHGDRVSLGVYQGPAAKAAYTWYKFRQRKNWNNYITCGLGLKYLWYNDVSVNTSKRDAPPVYRVQSETCLAAIPQFAIGTKHIKKEFCADFYIGLQFPVKDRMKTISYDQVSPPQINPKVPYNLNQVMVEPALLVGINLGIIKMRPKNFNQPKAN